MYGPTQRRLIARELARNNWKIGATLAALHRDYESLATLSESTLRKMVKRGDFLLSDEYESETVAQVRGKTDLSMEWVHQRAAALQDHPVRKWLVAAVNELRELARAKNDARTYKVLLDYLEILKSIDIPEDHGPPDLVPIDERHCKPYVPGCPDELKSWRMHPPTMPDGTPIVEPLPIPKPRRAKSKPSQPQP